jgi:hypothetical protein
MNCDSYGVDACRSWVANPEVEPASIAGVEAELDLRNEGLPFHLVQNELAILAHSQNFRRRE